MKRVRASAVCVYAGRLLCVRLRDPGTQVLRLFVPGGKIESGESPAQAAARELLEETGYSARVDESSELIARYDYPWNGVVFDCTTYFYRAALAQPGVPPSSVQDASYHEGVEWLALADVPKELSFHATMLHAIQRLL
jgi:8-oxo-dGTP pyrophosphatase MutT (NUDIX family)